MVDTYGKSSIWAVKMDIQNCTLNDGKQINWIIYIFQDISK